MEKQPRLLSSQFLLKSRVFEVTLNRSLLTWKEIQTKKKRVSGGAHNTFKVGSYCVPVSEIVAVRETDVDSRTKDERRWQKMSQRTTEGYPYAFTVSYVERARQHRWRCSDVTFHCSDSALCLQWIQSIREQLALLTSRPKHLLVYINPYGGKQQGKRIYEEKVAPLFSRASISTDVIVTEYANHARDHLLKGADLKKYDGVVCVGGDGMFSEIIHGLISRTQRDAGVDQNRPEQKLVPCGLRIGIIPAGSTDCISYATVGINDPVTSALHIIVGDSQPLDVCSVHHNNTFLRYSVSLLGYGFYGDVLTDSERKRWMGPARYDFSGFKTFLTHHYYEGTISFLPATNILGTPRDKTRCRAGCYICQHNGQLFSEDGQPYKSDEDTFHSEYGSDWRVIRGKFLAINAASMSCACPRSPKGLSPSAHLADGTTDLILVRKCSRINFLRHLLRHTNKDDQFDLSFVEVHRVRRFRFIPKYCGGDLELDLREGVRGHELGLFGHICRDHPACGCAPVNSSWNCDGEILSHAAIEVGVHCQLIRLFARGIEEQPVFDDPCVPSVI
ncbi:ceramide kinase-like isoform X2 [Megalops cyprinoides]|uniref:ceramide kinase-like isoform X2 n=1 Tax=Megalops cyprinoides TaxID=118141 RepID=UPI0018643D17|nr:ceramide kinase-like isoform X2 [Megalops cyprinoides]